MSTERFRQSILLVGAGGMAEGYLLAANRMGYDVGVVETPGRYAALADRFPWIVDFEPVDERAAARDESWLAPAMTLAERLRPRAVWGFAEPQVLAATVVQYRLGLPNVGLDAAVVSRNKALQRSEFQRAGLSQPDHCFVDHLSKAAEWALARLPVVVKPISAQGSQGVERVSSEEDWQEAVSRRGSDGPLLVEEFIEGQEYSLEAIVEDGRILFTNLTRKETSGPPYFVELFHEVGYGVESPHVHRAAEELARGAVGAMRLSTGVVHMEFYDAGKYTVLVEIAVRTPGEHIMELISRAYGFDFFEACLRLALREPPILPPGKEPVRSTGSVFFVADRAGILRTVPLAERANLSGVARHAMRLQPGAAVRPAQDSGDRLAYAVLDCDTAEQLRALAGKLRVDVIPDVDSFPQGTGG